MVKLTHKEKIKMAKKLLTSDERKIGIPKFLSTGWERRRNAIKMRKMKFKIADNQIVNQKHINWLWLLPLILAILCTIYLLLKI